MTAEANLNQLNIELQEKADSLKRHNDALVEFLDLAAHELQSPLWSILGFAAKLQKRYGDQLDEQGRHCIERINANVAEMHQLITDVTTILMVDPDNMTRKNVRLHEIVLDAIRLVRNEIDDKFQCEIEGFEKLVFLGDPRHLKQMFYQIVKNAALYTPSDKPGRLEIQVQFEKDRTHFHFRDRGIGIEPCYHEQVFRPMEKLKELDVPGSGMGLTYARRVAAAHGGDIHIENGQGQGVHVHLRMPVELLVHPKPKGNS